MFHNNNINPRIPCQKHKNTKTQKTPDNGLPAHKAVQALVYIHEHYAKGLERCSVSSDSFGSYPTYDAQGHLLHYKVHQGAVYWYTTGTLLVH